MNVMLPLAIQPCQDTRDVVLLNKNRGLYLKPAAFLHLRVQLPTGAGKCVSNRDLMESIKSLVQPDRFVSLKVSTSSPDYVEFEAELESCHQIRTVLQCLDRQMFRLNSSPEIFRITAVEAHTSSPSSHEWDSFFHNAPQMNKLRAGERPDTVHIQGLPCIWFSSTLPKLNEKPVKPSESVLREVFETFGVLSAVDIPMLDPFRSKISVNQSKDTELTSDGFFEAYLQFLDYGSFVKCMSAFRGMKLLYTNGHYSWTVSIKVDFDRTKHLSEHSIQERKRAREKLLQQELDQERAEKRRREAEERLKDAKAHQANKDEEEKVALEERKLVLAQRKVESLRLLDFLLDKVKAAMEGRKQRKDQGGDRDQQLHSRMISKYKQVGEKRLEQQKDKLRWTVDSCHVKLNRMASLRGKGADPVVRSGRDEFVRKPYRRPSDFDELWHGPDMRNHNKFRKPYTRHGHHSGKFHHF